MSKTENILRGTTRTRSWNVQRDTTRSKEAANCLEADSSLDAASDWYWASFSQVHANLTSGYVKTIMENGKTSWIFPLNMVDLSIVVCQRQRVFAQVQPTACGKVGNGQEGATWRAGFFRWNPQILIFTDQFLMVRCWLTNSKFLFLNDLYYCTPKHLRLILIFMLYHR